MQCFQQLLASSVFRGFLFHTLLSFFFLVFSPHFVSCFHLPWLHVPLQCCVYPVLNPVGFERQVCLQVLASVLMPVFEVQHLPSSWGNAEGAASYQGAVTALGEEEQTPIITGNGELSVLLLLFSHLRFKGFCGFFPASSPDDHGNSNGSHVKIFLPKKLLECLPKCSSLPKERHRWNTNERS